MPGTSNSLRARSTSWSTSCAAQMAAALSASARHLAVVKQLIIDLSLGQAAPARHLLDGVHAGHSTLNQRLYRVFERGIVGDGFGGFADQQRDLAFDGIARRQLLANLGRGSAQILFVQLGKLSPHYHRP